jgi:hypothetical protein
MDRNLEPTVTSHAQGPAEALRRPGARTSPAVLQRRLRNIHLYLGMLFAPSLLFFAATGALQLFSLHEVRPNRAFVPPALFQELGMVHKDQVFALPRRRTPPPAAPQVAAPAGGETSPAAAALAPPQTAGRGEGWQVLALKIFFLLAAVGLFATTCLGVWIGLRPGRNRAAAAGLLVAGVAIPVLLLLV